MTNVFIGIGRLTKEPELRRTQTGVPVTSFTLAINRTYTDDKGQKQVDYIPCVIWNKGAENVARYTTKGSLVGVEGRIQSRSYDGKDGKKVFVVEVNCDSVQFLETKSSQDQRPGQQPQPRNQVKGADVSDDFDSFEADFDISDDDIPF